MGIKLKMSSVTLHCQQFSILLCVLYEISKDRYLNDTVLEGRSPVEIFANSASMMQRVAFAVLTRVYFLKDSVSGSRFKISRSEVVPSFTAFAIARTEIIHIRCCRPL